MKKLTMVLLVCVLLTISALGADFTKDLSDYVTVTGTALDNGQYLVTVTQNGQTKEVTLTGVDTLQPILLGDGKHMDTTRIRTVKNVTMDAKDDSYSQAFAKETAQLYGLLDLETMKVLAQPKYFFADYGPAYSDFDHAIVAVGTTKFSTYKGQTKPLDGKFGVIDRDFHEGIPCDKDKVTWVAGNFYNCDGRYLVPDSKNHFGWVDAFTQDVATYDRYLLEFDGNSFLVDGDLNIIYTGYAPYAQLDFGKWRFENNNDVGDTAVIDNEGKVLPQFDITASGKISPWAKGYVADAENSIINTEAQPFVELDTAFYTEDITRLGFCILVENFLAEQGIANPVGKELPFTDINMDQSAIQTCYRLGIVQGKTNTTYAPPPGTTREVLFDPYANITRQEAATMLIRLCKVLHLDTTAKNPETRFSDCKNLEIWAKEGVFTISALKNTKGEAIMGGTSATTFAPLDNYTLEEAITTLVRLSNVPAMVPTMPYDSVLEYNEKGVAVARDGLATGETVAFFVDKDGKVLSDLYETAQPFQNGWASVMQHGKYAFIDEDFQPITDFCYDDAGQYYVEEQGAIPGGFQGGLARVSRSGLWGYIDETGNEVVPCQYGSAHLFAEGLALVTDVEPHRLQTERVHYGFVDKTGTLVIPMTYDYAKDFQDGMAIVKKDNLWGAIDKEGQEILPCQYPYEKHLTDQLAKLS